MTEVIVKPNLAEEAVVLLPVLFEQTFDHRLRFGRRAGEVDEPLFRERRGKLGRHRQWL